ncbi:alpha/beta hydrolase [Glaciimonas sp. CA11.2]|uniref:alpha/beta hydrolase n=1 Tax=Glaciimonas sp. CA11.2 TaxID=3048601 RepID=UPI002AB4A03C|nr:alpha/beta hydrolase [Glaciimonas sp. CA11.2]MDY7545733.1 alpha/beta hydrolase [Glaciimonas sp. CA11.2]MEB0162103.1 alpha/beta hydrolase [Glaciimonas sp. CA11.2]
MVLLSKIALIFCAVTLALVATVACSPLTAINALTTESTYDKTSDVVYGANDRNQLDIYTPKNLHAAAPVVVFFYGGSWSSGARGDYAFVGEALASRGVVAVVADYRLYPEVRYPTFLEDGAHAIAWTVREISKYGGDPKRLYVMGHSSGAYNAAMLALDPRWLAEVHLTPAVLRGWIGLAGPYDFLPIENRGVRPVFFFPNSPVDSQPINHVTSLAPPTLLIAANTDSLVNPVRNTGGLAAALRTAHVPVSEQYFDHVSHATLVGAISRPLRGLAPVLDTVDKFIKSDAGRIASPISPDQSDQKSVALNAQ